MSDIGDAGITMTTSRRSPFTDLRITTKNSKRVTLEVTGGVSDVKAGPRTQHEWRLEENGDVKHAHASAPVEVYNPSLMRFVFGSGLSLRQDDHVDFVVDENILRVENASRLRLATTMGALLKVGEFGNGLPIDVLLSLDFSQEPRRTLDGFMFGIAFGINKYMSVGGGYELRVGRELSPGFRRTSAQLVEELLEEKQYKSAYARFSDLVDPAFQDLVHYDWFPLEDPRQQRQVVFGEPLIASFNHGWFLGVFIPIDFKRLFSIRD